MGTSRSSYIQVPPSPPPPPPRLNSKKWGNLRTVDETKQLVARSNPFREFFIPCIGPWVYIEEGGRAYQKKALRLQVRELIFGKGRGIHFKGKIVFRIIQYFNNRYTFEQKAWARSIEF